MADPKPLVGRRSPTDLDALRNFVEALPEHENMTTSVDTFLEIIDRCEIAEACAATPHTFEWALIQMKAGKKVTRQGQRVFWLQNCAFMSMAKDGSLPGGVHITNFDLLATDWQLHEDKTS